MDETQRQRALREEVLDVVNGVADVVIEQTGTNVFNACVEWAYTYPAAAMAPSQASPGLTRILDLSRGLVIPTVQIPGTWGVLVGHLCSGRPTSQASAKLVFDRACFGVDGAQDSTYSMLVRFLYLAAKRYEDEGLTTLNQPYQILLGPPGGGRIGISEARLHSADGIRRLTDVPTLPKVLGKSLGYPVKPGWQLGSLARHVKQLSPSAGGRLTRMYSALPLPDRDLRKLILSPFKLRNIDYDGPEDEVQEDTADTKALALLNQLSEMYV